MIVTHNLQQAFRVADHVAFMHLGELVEYGPSEQVFDRPRSSARATTSAGRSGETRRRAALLLALALGGCESNQETSAQLAKLGHRQAAPRASRVSRSRTRAPT